MPEIKILPNDLINKIAAGEVVERPVSVVKELVENSIDADASSIEIFIIDGGKTEIKVIDNGIGIEKKQVELSVRRHATSKLTQKNFNKISTLGFRGEALPSIASISDFSIQSNNKNDMEGMEIRVSSGEFKYFKPVRKSKGTSVTVKNLFFSTPARLKFLKSSNYESLLIKDLIKKFALCKFNINFSLTIDGKKVLTTNFNMDKDSNEKFKTRVVEVLGEEFKINTVDFSKKNEKFNFIGLAGLPTFHFSNTKNQFVFINGRVISDKSFNQIFKVGYRDFIPYDRFPQFILFLECDFDEIDVNVHPSKNEVRFKNITEVRSSIISLIKKTISSIGHKSSLTNTQEIIKKFENATFQTKLNLKDHVTRENLQNGEDDSSKSISSNAENNFPLGYAKTQFHKNFIVSQTDKGIVIVDQHAAHERIVYEELKESFYKKKLKKQILLIPVIIDLDRTTLDNINDKLGFIYSYGLKIEVFGNNSIVVREIPSVLSDSNVKQLTLDVIEEIVHLDKNYEIEKQINKILSKMACYGSVRSGREMQIDEMNNLLRKMETTAFSGQCNHGRPTYIELKLEDIEKLFGRK